MPTLITNTLSVQCTGNVQQRCNEKIICNTYENGKTIL